MPTELAVDYRDVTIRYREYTNDWSFVLRGRERAAPSLKKAKEIIAKPAPKKGKPFQKFEAWHISGRTIETVTVLFVANASWKGDRQVRVRFHEGTKLTSKGDERNVDAGRVFPKNAHNDRHAAEIQSLVKAVAEAEAGIDAARDLMKCYSPAEEQTDEQESPCPKS